MLGGNNCFWNFFKLHNHRYFELFKVKDGDTVVDLMNLYAHSPLSVIFQPCGDLFVQTNMQDMLFSIYDQLRPEIAYYYPLRG